ncbi:hypothetical protein IQ268_31400 [Oculatella sp. LEGE 06141]|uniref:CIS tube protein n=1 Tax=Oculatella sp. LEGE 06141 TaxID=1828648 RepID=UPI00187E82E0|nr:hypothetical protein [Oculatella sp. LEGE 06141]MBE9183043.1 hypothetical protein [Oculatella sp. LEGE 06141]
MTLEKATLTPYNGEPGVPVEFMFNPTQLAFARNVKWQSEQGNRGNSALPKVNFSGVDPFKLTLNQLVFDTYETHESVVEKYIKNLKKGVESPDGKNKRPPVYYLQWGQKKTFLCVMLSLSYKLDMFLPDGTPVRALVDISLQEVEKENLPGDRQPNSTGRARQTDGRNARSQRNQGQQPPPSSDPANQSDF